MRTEIEITDEELLRIIRKRFGFADYYYINKEGQLCLPDCYGDELVSYQSVKAFKGYNLIREAIQEEIEDGYKEE